MSTVTISPKFQIVIPKEVRQQLGLSVGQKLDLVVHDGHLEVIPSVPIESLRGILKGIDTDLDKERGEDRY